VVIRTKRKRLHGYGDCIDAFIRGVKQTKKTHIAPVGAIAGPAHLMRKNAALGGIDRVGLLINHVDLDTDQTVY
jgi:hypothetical protein